LRVGFPLKTVSLVLLFAFAVALNADLGSDPNGPLRLGPFSSLDTSQQVALQFEKWVSGSSVFTINNFGEATACFSFYEDGPLVKKDVPTLKPGNELGPFFAQAKLNKNAQLKFQVKYDPLCPVCGKPSYLEIAPMDSPYSTKRIEFLIPCQANHVVAYNGKKDDKFNVVLRKYMNALAKEGLSTRFVNFQDPATGKSFAFDMPKKDWKTFKTAFDKIQTKTQNKYLLILGGVDQIPQPRHYTGKDPTRAIPDSVASDDCYGSRNPSCTEKTKPDIAVGRFPTSADQSKKTTFLQNLLEMNIKNRHKTTSRFTLISDSCGTPGGSAKVPLPLEKCPIFEETNRVSTILFGKPCQESGNRCRLAPHACYQISPSFSTERGEEKAEPSTSSCKVDESLDLMRNFDIIFFSSHGTEDSLSGYTRYGEYVRLFSTPAHLKESKKILEKIKKTIAYLKGLQTQAESSLPLYKSVPKEHGLYASSSKKLTHTEVKKQLGYFEIERDSFEKNMQNYKEYYSQLNLEKNAPILGLFGCNTGLVDYQLKYEKGSPRYIPDRPPEKVEDSLPVWSLSKGARAVIAPTRLSGFGCTIYTELPLYKRLRDQKRLGDAFLIMKQQGCPSDIWKKIPDSEKTKLEKGCAQETNIHVLYGDPTLPLRPSAN